ncbi:MAG: ComEC/Rec2 family competence protein [Clostridia bacterium]|nr:MBL fold metallo-hydrolase [Clostridia bacterium]MEE1115269.1 ComEC/Rec2 family competence protein [Clostridia bacterium]
MANNTHLRRPKKSSGGARFTVVTFVVLIVVALCYLGYTYLAPMLGIGLTETGSETRQPVTLDGEMQLHVIDVGQGDSTLIMSKDGIVLVDAGPGSAEDSLVEYLKDVGITTIDYAIFTHPDEDHIGGADVVINNFEVKNVIMPNATKTTKTFEKMIEAIEQSNANVIEATSGASYTLGDIAFRILAPNKASYSATNNYSVVVKLTYGNNTFMLTGDAESESESEILAKYPASELRADFLKVGHHGSSTSTSTAFLTAVSPSIASISCGEDNKYNHPHRETIEKLQGANIKVYRTDLLSTIVFVCDGNTISVVEK